MILNGKTLYIVVYNDALDDSIRTRTFYNEYSMRSFIQKNVFFWSEYIILEYVTGTLNPHTRKEVLKEMKEIERY